MWQVTNASIIIYWVIYISKSCAQVCWSIFIQLRLNRALHIRITLLHSYKLRREQFPFFFFITYKWSNFAYLIWNYLRYNLVSCHTIIECLIMIIFLQDSIFITIWVYHWPWLLIFLIHNRDKLFLVLILLTYLFVHSLLLQLL